MNEMVALLLEFGQMAVRARQAETAVAQRDERIKELENEVKMLKEPPAPSKENA